MVLYGYVFFNLLDWYKMTQDEIIRMAREVWGERAVLPFNDLKRFAALVAAHEREACAKVCEEFGTLGDSESRSHAEAFAAAIRSRSEK